MRDRTDYVIIHCAATRPSMNIDIAEIDRWHRSRGFLKVGYHFVIRRDGVLERGRDLLEPGAHARGYNNKSIGICMVGGVTEDDITIAEDNFTDPQWESLQQLYRMLRMEFPGASWIGHNEVSHKECPSFDVQQWVQTILVN